MLPKFLGVCSFVCLTFSLTYAQSVISTAGNQFKSTSGYSLEWTLGQVMIQTESLDSTIITQGFHQPNLSIVTSLRKGTWEGIVNVFPNPTAQVLTIDAEQVSKGYFMLFSSDGVKRQSGEWGLGSTKVDLGQQSPGTYHLLLFEKQEAVFSVKIIKSQ